jgi:serine/threonine-protein kinase
MDWEDDDEQTTVFDRDGAQDAARSLLQNSPGNLGVPPPPMSRPPAALPVPPPPPVADRLSNPTPEIAARMPPPPAPQSRLLLYVMVGTVVLLAAAFVGLLLRDEKGSLIVTVAGPGNRPLAGVEVLVDGKVTCTESPCRRKDLEIGTYLVQARAEGYELTAKTAIPVTSGKETVLNIQLTQAGQTGVRVLGEGTGLTLFVDGKARGPLPQEVSDLKAGEHVVRVEGGERYEPMEERLTLAEDELRTLGPIRLKVLTGLASIELGENAEGAKVSLKSGNIRRRLDKLPIKLDVPTDKEHTLIATKDGFDTYREKLIFDDGVAEKRFLISLTETGSAPKATPAARPDPASSPSPRPVAAETGTLNLNSIPRSHVILDGRPLGQTPKIGLKVNAGTHTVVFVKDGDRRTQSVTLPAGATKTIAVRF